MRRFLFAFPLSLFLMTSAPDGIATTAPASADGDATGPVHALAQRYDRELRVPDLEDRTFSAEHWWQVTMPLLEAGSGFSIEQVGTSAEGRPLRLVSWGNGPVPVFLWSQMHGDESTASMSLADLFRFLGEHPDDAQVARLRNALSVHVLPIVNPDGAARFQRRNAQGIDINRDARALATPEGRTLKAVRDRLQPAFGFNLHDQGVGYRAGDSERGVAIALLAPPFNEAREINDVRARAIGVSAVIREALEPYIAGHMARWSDEFNPRAFGDLVTQWGTSTILIESGGIEGDPEKQLLRKLNFLAIVTALDAIADGRYAQADPALYHSLPENSTPWPDLLIQGATVVEGDGTHLAADVLVNFRHALAERGGSIADIGDLADRRARHRIDASGLYLLPLASEAGAEPPARLRNGAPAWFLLSRDPQGKEPVWTLAGDVDPAHPRP